jgi:hypothetical protein
MGKFIEVTCADSGGKSSKRLVNTAWVFDITPTAEYGAKTMIRFAPTDGNGYDRTYPHVIYALEKYEHIKQIILDDEC